MVVVSIVCNTYNHELYIRDALDSFLSQKTNFPFEILVFDDASTDKTANIIRSYEEKYPDIIKPVYQTVNQYSLGLMPGKQNRERATGKYIAICEGDDYWCDCNKLQKQVDYMESHPDCTFCFTNGYVKYGNNEINKTRQIVPWDKNAKFKKNVFDLDVGEVEQFGFIPTCSFLFKNNIDMLAVSPNAFQGDTYLKISMTNAGYAHFMDEPMVVYRRGVQNSATAVWQKNIKYYVKQCDSFIVLFSDLKNILDNKYSNVMKMRICQWKINKYYTLRDYKSLRHLVSSGEIMALRYGNAHSIVSYGIKCLFPKTTDKLRAHMDHR